MIKYENLNQLDTAGNYLVKLLFSVLHKKEVPALPSDLSWELIFHMAKAHSVAAMAFYGAEKFIKKNVQLYSIWKRCKEANLAQSIIQEEARREIFHSLYEADIRFLPLKGYELKRLYEKPEFRQMSDIDILIDPENAARLRPLMEGLGYTYDEESPAYHDEYTKPPCITIEFHKQMLPVDNLNEDYYKSIWKNAVPDEEIPGGWKLRHEDFYIYQIAHFWRHYNERGSGIRSILDVYLYLKNFRNKMNWNYIENEFHKLGLYKFSAEVDTLSQYWFSDVNKDYFPYSNELFKLQRNLFLSGAYGSREFEKSYLMDAMHIEDGKLSKIKYVYSRIFLSREQLEYNYPCLKKYPALIPFFGIYRLIYSVLHKKSSIKKEFELFKTKSKSK